MIVGPSAVVGKISRPRYQKSRTTSLACLATKSWHDPSCALVSPTFPPNCCMLIMKCNMIYRQSQHTLRARSSRLPFRSAVKPTCSRLLSVMPRVQNGRRHHAWATAAFQSSAKRWWCASFWRTGYIRQLEVCQLRIP